MRYCSSRWVFVLAAASLLASEPLPAQAGPVRRWFVVTESRYYHALWLNFGDSDQGHYLLAEVGALRNVSRRTALGFTAWGGQDFGPEATRIGISFRARHWVSPHSSLEGSVGPAWSSDPLKKGFLNSLGATTHFDVNFADDVQLGLRLEWEPEPGHCPAAYRDSYGGCSEDVRVTCPPSAPPYTQCYQGVNRREPGVWRGYVGVGLGSKFGRIGYVVAGALGLLAAAWGNSSW